MLVIFTSWFKKAIANPNTTVFGIAKIIGVLWYIYTHWASIDPLHFMHPETFLPFGILIDGIKDLLTADAATNKPTNHG